MNRYMTRKQYERHVAVTKQTEEKLAVARKKVGKAAEHGDLSENAEYEAAIEESGFLTGRVEELRAALTGVNVIDPRNTDPTMVSIGKTVTIKDTETGSEESYHIVGVGVTDTDGGEVSYSAPLGGALVGSAKGDIVTAELPGGTRTLEIVDIAIYG
jgi:transcription elongation factor GreA